MRQVFNHISIYTEYVYSSPYAGGQDMAESSNDHSHSTSLHELFPHMSQLHSFIAATEGGLAKVTSLKVTLKQAQKNDHSHHHMTNSHLMTAGKKHKSQCSSMDIAHCVAHAFPHLQHLGIGGGTGEASSHKGAQRGVLFTH